MKIVHCIFTMVTGGAQILVVDMLNGLPIENEITLIIVNDKYDDHLLATINKNVTIHFIKRKEGSINIFSIFKLNKILYKIKPDVVHCHEPNMVKLFLYKRFRNILTIHTVGIIELYERKYDKIISISESVSGDIKNRKALELPVINNGIPFELFKRKENYISQPALPLKIVQVSRLNHKIKGQNILLNVIKKLHFDFLINIELTFIGDGPSFNYLVELAQKNNITHIVHFLGNKDRKWIMDNLSSFDLLVQPSLFEGFGLTIVEGIAAGLPILASDIYGPKEILKDWQSDFLFECENVIDCCNKINNIHALYKKNEIGKIMEDVYFKTIKKYTIHKMNKSYFNIYEQISN